MIEPGHPLMVPSDPPTHWGMTSALTSDAARFLDESVDATVVLDSGGHIVAVSDSMLRRSGYRAEELLGRWGMDLAHPDDAGAAMASLAGTVAEVGRHSPLRIRFRDKSGSWRPLELVANSLADPRGTVVLSLRDRTGQLGYEEMLVDRSELYRQVVELAAEGVWIIDDESRTTFTSPPMAAMLGWTAGEMLGRKIFDFMDDDGVAVAEQQFERRGAGPAENHPFRFVHRDGHPIWTRMNTTPLGAGDPYRGAIAVVSDITEQHLEHERVARERSRQRALLDALPDLMLHLDERGTYLDFHTRTIDDLPAPPEELLGRTIHDLLPSDAASAIQSAIQRTLGSGQTQDVAFTHGWVARVGGGPGERVPRMWSARLAPSGPDSIVAIIRDVTELRRAEEARIGWELEVQRRVAAEERAALEEQIQRTARLESLGRLAGGVAHDVNNLLGVIGNYVAVIRRSIPETAVLDDLTEIEKAVRRGSELTRRLLLFGRADGRPPSPLDVTGVVAECCRSLTGTAGPAIETRITSEPCDVLIDRSQLEQLVVNLIMNAQDASPADGLVTVTVARAADDELAADPSLADTPHVRVTVQDEGPGIPEDIRDQVIEPFFTTKEVGRGTGLGLAVVHGVTEAAGGKLDIGGSDRGAEITALLPMLRRPVSDVGSRPVLVVDDDPDVLRSTALLLEAHDVPVVTAGSVDEALLVLESDVVVGAVLCDILMPGRSGLELEQILARRHPHLTVAFMTGYAADHRDELPEDRPVLAKPLAISEALRVLGVEPAGRELIGTDRPVQPAPR